MLRRTKQLELFAVKARKGRRRRKVGAVHASEGRMEGLLPHVARPEHREEHPVHVSMRRVTNGPSFRSQRVCAAIVGQITDAKRRGVRVLQYSVQDNHLHLMIEGRDSADLSHQMRTLFSRIAFAVNRVARRYGKLFRDRHHRHELRTPTETRNALVYILFNDRKHMRGGQASASATASATATATASACAAGPSDEDLDLCSSALWFTDWDPRVRLPPLTREEMGVLASDMERPTSLPETWLARTGWRRAGGPIRFNERPRLER